MLVIDEAYNLNDSLYGKQALDTIVEKVQGGDDRAVLLLGYEHQLLEMLRTQNPGLARRFPREYAFKFEDYTDKELLDIFNETCKRQYLYLSSFKVAEKALEVLVKVFIRSYRLIVFQFFNFSFPFYKQLMLPNFGNAGSMNLLIQNAVTKASSRPDSERDGRLELIPEDIDTGVQGTARPDVGHFVFRGSVGTGKTKVARVMTKILFQMDCLATEQIVETSGLQLTGDYLGQTKTKVTQKMSEAKGGVLFIDEAYELGKGMYGNEAMTTILEGMTSREYKELVIVIAGYINEIDEMLDRNPGLKSRFTEYLEFKDCVPARRVSLIVSYANKDGLTVVQDAEHRLLAGFEVLQKLQGWANG